ncbi:hypothetical protein C8T65DRAFT_23048 [Cerioporus squamosus]|nr:hypothetical protein C8T65DRAFT_23048 [Cerioporus squamosus]
MTTVYQAPPCMHEDVLYHVFNKQGVQEETLLNAALVCHAWTQPAQSSLYREIVFSPMDNRRRDLLLARSMRTYPHLRRHVRCLKLITLWTHAPAPDLCDWIRLLPAHCLREFHWIWMRGHLFPALLEYPAVQTVTCLTLKDGSTGQAHCSRSSSCHTFGVYPSNSQGMRAVNSMDTGRRRSSISTSTFPLDTAPSSTRFLLPSGRRCCHSAWTAKWG